MSAALALRRNLLDALEAVRALWSGAFVDDDRVPLVEDAILVTGHHDRVEGRAAVAEALRTDFGAVGPVSLELANRVARASGSEAAVSAYFHGQGGEAGFGGLLVLLFDTDRNEPPIREIRIEAAWVEGGGAAVTGWRLPVNRQWQPGDRPAAVVSELDAPWNRVRHFTLDTSDEEASRRLGSASPGGSTRRTSHCSTAPSTRTPNWN